MAQVINLVHDMILRRDREQEQRESLSTTLRGLQTDATRNIVAMERLQNRNDDLTRQVSLLSSQDRSARMALKTAEASARALREEMIRMKAVVNQIRTACANDVRKRDVQIQRLKTHLTAQQRGNKTGLIGASITITPGITGVMGNSGPSKEGDSPDVEDPEYSLKQETTDFLTQLSQSLSDENDNLISLVRTTLVTLKDLQGLPEIAERAGLSDVMESEDGNEHMLQALPTSYDSLATDMHNVLENLRSLLTNPNFVPIEEVSIREEEILRLRDGWEKMEVKWREAIAMMDGWRKRMLSGGDTVNIEELKIGLGLGHGLSTAAKLNDQTPDQDDEVADEDGSFRSDVDVDDEDELALPAPEEMEEDFEEEQIGRSRSQDAAQVQTALREGDGNSKSPRKVSFASKSDSPAVSIGNKDENGKALSGLPTPSFKRPQSTSLGKHKTASPKEGESRIPRKVRFSESTILASPYADAKAAHPSHVYHFIDPLQTLKRLSSPHAEERAPKLTMQEKLNIAQAEAEAAAVAAGLDVNGMEVQFEGFGQESTKARGEIRNTESRKTKIVGRARRRKSTLTPAELEMLLND
ncbi:hypothetical protein EJ08DRAFT_697718 [Tothia fuscella]|uniref:Uncharacterized protein n=1 Tax=Tothia fuscella TaxID=1048955 RepID=A0A9P4TYC8_9PEZI|nr:hypothetical protein EJ08DRAFT_697718 [Tothia fuscella]